jgi:hypothetical protein
MRIKIREEYDYYKAWAMPFFLLYKESYKARQNKREGNTRQQ